MCRLVGQKLLVETPEIHSSVDMQAYILQELNRPCKKWVGDVINGVREASEVRLRTSEFVLLPDTERVNRYQRVPPADWTEARGQMTRRASPAPLADHTNEQWGGIRTRMLCNSRKNAPSPAFRYRNSPGLCMRQPRCFSYGLPRPFFYQNRLNHHDAERVCQYQAVEPPPPKLGQEEPEPAQHFTEQVNWLAIATEPGLRSLRDLRGRHAPMLRRMLALSKLRIQEETGVHQEEIMAYVHYPPSVYQLHVHFAYPYAQYNHRDVFRIHSLETVINNLEIDPEYYQKARLQVSLPKNSVLHQICCREPIEPVPQLDLGPPLERRKSI